MNKTSDSLVLKSNKLHMSCFVSYMGEHYTTNTEQRRKQADQWPNVVASSELINIQRNLYCHFITSLTLQPTKSRPMYNVPTL